MYSYRIVILIKYKWNTFEDAMLFLNIGYYYTYKQETAYLSRAHKHHNKNHIFMLFQEMKSLSQYFTHHASYSTCSQFKHSQILKCYTFEVLS